MANAAPRASRRVEPIQVHTRGAPIYSAGEQKAPAVQRLYRPAHKGSFRLEYIWLGNQNLWRIRHTRPESPQLDSRAGEKNYFGSFVSGPTLLLELCSVTRREIETGETH